MHIENAVKLDFKDVWIRPKRSTLSSRSDADIKPEFVCRYSQKKCHGIPTIATNIDITETAQMALALGEYGLSAVLREH